jgi:hypothetical protein
MSNKRVQRRIRAARKLSDCLYQQLPNAEGKLKAISENAHDYPWPSQAFIDCMTAGSLRHSPLRAKEFLQRRRVELEKLKDYENTGVWPT